MEGAKIYGLCLERLKHQIRNAQGKVHGTPLQERVILEGYNTGDIEEIIDILELYDIEDRSLQGLQERLDDLAYTVSVLTNETLFFGFTDEGHLGIYLVSPHKATDVVEQERLVTAGAF